MKVCLDAGHGGEDTGAIADNGLREKDYTLTQALLAESLLKAHGFKVVMTRRGDITMANSQRARLANDENVDVFVSYHFNAAGTKLASGTQVLHHKDSPKGKALALLLLEKVAPLDHEFGERWERIIGLPMPGFRGGNFIPTVLSATRMAAVIIETEFGTHPASARLLTSATYIMSVADATAAALKEWQP